MAPTYRLIRPPAPGDVELTPAQVRLVAHRSGVRLGLGGRRSGKTTALVAAGAAALGAGAPAVLFVAASRPARQAVRSGVAVAYPEVFDRFEVTTFHAWAAAVVGRWDGPPHVLDAARQDLYVRTVLAGQPAGAWPASYADLRRTDRFAVAVREAVAGLQRAGLTPAEVRRRGEAAGRADWVGLADFYAEYLDVLYLAGVTDYPETLIRAGQLLARPEVLDAECPPGALVLIDDAEDADWAQAGLIAALTTSGRAAIVATDPDAQVSGFRGAPGAGLGALIGEWTTRGVYAGTVVLDDRGGEGAVEAACAGLRRRIPLPGGIGVADLEAYRRPRGEAGSVRKVRFASRLDEAGQIAAWLADAHREGTAWSDMAVLVRRRDAFARYAVACQTAGVPVVLSGDEIQLNQEPIVAAVLERLRGAGEAAGTVGEVLGTVWEAMGVQPGLVEEAARGGVDGMAANRALDAVIALFALAAQFADLDAAAGIRALAEAVANQAVPEDLPASTSWSAPAVRLTTAHRAKGRTWSLVIVAGLEDGVWPAAYQPQGVVDLDGLDARLAVPGPAGHLGAERRLLYSACASTRHTLIVTAVDDEESTPSAFFDQLDVPVGAPPRVVESIPTPAALAGRLRTVVADETAHPGLRQAAADRLARLAANPVFRGAHPDTWWGAQPAPPPPVLHRDREVIVPASGVEFLLGCPRRWFWSNRAEARPGPTQAAGVGSAIHQAIQDPGADLAAMTERLVESFATVVFPAPWMAEAAFAEAVAALTRYDALRRARRREVVATEHRIEYAVGGTPPVRVEGRIDAVERDEAGRMWVIDYKTGRQVPTQAEAAANVQLGLYQVALGAGPDLAGAELVFLGVPAGVGSALPKVLRQPSLHTTPHLATDLDLPVFHTAYGVSAGDQRAFPTWVHHRLALAAALLGTGDYPAIGGSCRGCAYTRGCPVMEATR